MATFYVNQDSGSDSNNGSQSSPWKNWSYALYGKRLSGGDTLVVSGGIHDTLYGTATHGVTDVDGTGGDVRVVGADDFGTEIQSPANLTDSMIKGAVGGPRLLFSGIKFTNPNDKTQRIGESNANAKLVFDNCIIDYGVERHPFYASGGFLEIIGGKILSASSLIYTRSDNSVAVISDADVHACKYALYGTKIINFKVSECTFFGEEELRLFVYTATSEGLTGFFKQNKIAITAKNINPLYIYDTVYNAIINGRFIIENNVFYRNISGMSDTARLDVYHEIASKQSGCTYIPKKNYFIPFDSPTATNILTGNAPAQNTENTICGCGDSIVADGILGQKFQEITGQSLISDGSTAIGGANMHGVYWLVDEMMLKHSPRYVFVQAGINDFYSSVKDGSFISEAANMALSICHKIKEYGAIPIWCGCTPRNATQNSDIMSFNNESQRIMMENDILCFSIFSALLCDSEWSTKFYTNIETNVHPNTSGQNAIGLAWGKFFKFFVSGGQPLASPFASFDGSMPPLALAPSAPARLLEVQVWDKTVTKDEIGEVPK